MKPLFFLFILTLALSGCADFDANKFSQVVGTVGDAWERVDRQQHPERYLPADGPDTPQQYHPGYGYNFGH